MFISSRCLLPAATVYLCLAVPCCVAWRRRPPTQLLSQANLASLLDTRQTQRIVSTRFNSLAERK